MAQEIPFFDLAQQYQSIKEEVQDALVAVMEDTAFADGPFVASFENNFADFCDTAYALGVNSGTDAIHLALRSLGIGEGDEVIVPANTFIASVWGISYVNATPVFVDCDPATWNIDSTQLAEKITDRTKAIIGVHLYGQPFEVEAVQKIAREHNIYLIEDCAQAHGAQYKNQPVGSFTKVGCFSFYPGKNLGAYGEAGAITTDDEKLADHIDMQRDQGAREKYVHEVLGFNLRMDGFQGAVLDVKLPYLSQWNERRRHIAQRYRTEIDNKAIHFQHIPEHITPVYHLMVATVKDRPHFRSYLEEHNIGTALHYPIPCHLQEAYSHLGYQAGDFPNAEYLAEHCVSLPMFPELTEEQVNRVISVINDYEAPDS